MATLVTGGTGALGRELVPLLASEGRELFVLTRDPQHAAAVLPSQATLVHGDVTAGALLGMPEADAAMLQARVARIIHCAAATSFSLPIETARAVNVEGTRAVLGFARRCSRLEAVACASTAYVAGKRTGIIRERDGGGSAGFVNSYEQSKHEMEEVIHAAASELPVSICRFSTIIGHSATGAVGSFNAIHHALRLFYQGLAPMIPGDHATRIDLVPVDFAAAAMHRLSTDRFQSGRTYQLCAGEPNTCSLDELLSMTIEAFERTRPAWRKRRIVRPAVVDPDTYELFVRSVRESGNVVLQAATDAVQAFAWQLVYPKTFDTSVASAALAGTGVRVPHVRDYYEKVVEWCVTSNWGRAADGAAA